MPDQRNHPHRSIGHLTHTQPGQNWVRIHPDKSGNVHSSSSVALEEPFLANTGFCCVHGTMGGLLDGRMMRMAGRVTGHALAPDGTSCTPATSSVDKACTGEGT